MLQKLKKLILSYRKVAGVEAIIKGDGTIDYNLLVLSLNKNVLSVDTKESGITDLLKLKSLLPDETPIALTVNGRGVINKKIAEGSFTDDRELIQQLLPNAKEEDFFLQKVHSGKNVFVSVIRKDSFLKIVSVFESSHLPVVYSSCGPFLIATALPFISNEHESLGFSGYILSLKNKSIADFKPDDEKKQNVFIVGEEKIESMYLASYSSALHLFLKDSYSDGLNCKQVHAIGEEFRHKLLFKIGGYSVLGFLVLMMLSNYLFYNHFKSENNELVAQSKLYEGMVKEMEDLGVQVKEKEYFLQKAGWLSVPKTSYFADEIAATIPSSIRLSDIKINPLNNALSKRLKKNVFQTDTIYISGICGNPTVLNPWMKELKEMDWVKKARNINYVYDGKSRSGSFEVELIVGNEF